LLKGINVGGKKKVPMADLRALLAKQGFTDVATLLQSGNAVFEAPRTKPEKLAAQLERAITGEFGMEVRCLIRTGDELGAVIAGNPLADVADNGSKLLVMFLSEPLDPAQLAENDPTELDPVTIRLGDRVIYQWCPNGILEAPNVAGFVEKRFKIIVTGRNWNTVTKLGALLDA
jgi:uncharacterized protein (DUF1697 family)